MKFFDSMQQKIESASNKTLYRYIGVFIGIVLLLLALILYRHYSLVAHYRSMIKRINADRGNVQDLLTRNKLVEQQRAQVDGMLEQEPDFNLLEEFDKLKSELDLASDSTTLTTTDRGEYFESSVAAIFSGITMKQIVQLLEQIEKVLRITVKELEITRGKSNTVDVAITIATLRKKD